MSDKIRVVSHPVVSFKPISRRVMGLIWEKMRRPLDFGIGKRRAALRARGMPWSRRQMQRMSCRAR